jgi:hypothetical protein
LIWEKFNWFVRYPVWNIIPPLKCSRFSCAKPFAKKIEMKIDVKMNRMIRFLMIKVKYLSVSS